MLAKPSRTGSSPSPIAGIFATLALGAVPAQELPLIPLSAAPAVVEFEQRPWPASIPNPSFGKTFAAHLTGHTIPDVVLLDGQNLLLATAPGIHSSVGPVPGIDPTTSVLDCAALATSQALGSLQALAWVSPTGLRIWQFDPTTKTTLSSTVVSTLWAGATAVSTHPGDGSVIFGVNAAGTSILAADVASGNGQNPRAIWTHTGTITAIECIDWDGDGATDIAALTDDGVRIFDRTGNWQAEDLSVTAAPGLLQRVRYRDAELNITFDEWLAWVAPTDANDVLRVLHRDTATANVLPLQGVFVALAAGDVSADGADELILSTGNHNHVSLLHNAHGATPDVFMPQFALGARIEFTQPNALQGSHVARPAVADFDGDGDADLLMPVASSAPSLSLLRTNNHSHEPLSKIAEIDPVPGAPGELDYSFDTTIAPGNATHIELVIWERTGADSMAGQSYLREFFDRSPDPLDETVTITFTLEEAQILLDGYVLMLRSVIRQPNGHIDVVAVADLAHTHTQASLIYSLGGGGTRVGGVGPKVPLPSTEPPESPPIPGGG